MFFSFCQRRVETKEPIVYLSFDDGPDPKITPALADLLKELGANASFFVIAKNAQSQKEIVRRLLNEGHAIGNHSLDHRYGIFFRPEKELKMWIEEAQTALSTLIGTRPIGFRSPAGVITPRLVSALKELSIPLIHWNKRFFDTNFTFTPARARRAAQSLSGGDIILLHDGNCRNPATFLSSVTGLIRLGKDRGFQFRALTTLDLDTTH
jgi:peptidoglycan-N-acetylglucosamine deacetylase